MPIIPINEYQLTNIEIASLSETTELPIREKTTKPKRQWRTGRNQQLGLKVTLDSLEKFYAIADQMGKPLGEVFGIAVDMLVESRKNR